MLVQRWGILRMAMPQNLSVAKVFCMVIALAKLHNFCIGESDAPEWRAIPQLLDIDRNHMMNASTGYVGLRNVNPEHTRAVVPIDLLHLGRIFLIFHEDLLSINDDRWHRLYCLGLYCLK